jgi:site-specific recombinase XerD
MSGALLHEPLALFLASRRTLCRDVRTASQRLVTMLMERITKRLGRAPFVCDLLPADLAELVWHIAATRGRTSPAKAASTLRMLGRFLLSRGLVLLDPARGLSTPKLDKSLGWVPTVGEVERLLSFCEPASVLSRADLDRPPDRARRRRLRRVRQAARRRDGRSMARPRPSRAPVRLGAQDE